MSIKTWKTLFVAACTLSAVLVVFSFTSYEKYSNLKDRLMESSLATANTALINAQKDLDRKEYTAASRYVSIASGALISIELPMEQLGIPHVPDIALQLRHVSNVISQPDNTSKSQFKQSEKFINITQRNLSNCFTANGFLKNKQVPNSMHVIYMHIPK